MACMRVPHRPQGSELPTKASTTLRIGYPIGQIGSRVNPMVPIQPVTCLLPLAVAISCHHRALSLAYVVAYLRCRLPVLSLACVVACLRCRLPTLSLTCVVA